MTNNTPPICDYEGSSYRTDFWEGKGREYEDIAERIALSHLLPFNAGKRLLEIGAGYGRLTNMYHAYEQVVVMDYSLSQVQQAKEYLGEHQRYVYVAGDVYNMPFAEGVFDGAAMIRVIHHLKDATRALSQVRRILAPKGLFILEHANKRNLKAMLRYALGLQDWNPYTRIPHEFVDLNIDFHPSYIVDELRSADFEIMRRIPVSYFRLGALKQTIPTEVLVRLDELLQQTAWFYSPSIFTKNLALGNTPNNVTAPRKNPDALFASPKTGNALQRDGDVMVDTITGTKWGIQDGIYDFRAPL